MKSRFNVCAETDCHIIHEGKGRCPTCRSLHEKQRGTKKQRGYGAEFDAEKRKLKASRPTNCVHCGSLFTPDNPMQAGHATAIRHGGTAAHGLLAHCRTCNEGWRATGL